MIIEIGKVLYTAKTHTTGEDDVMLLMLPVPLSNMSFGRGALMSDMDPPWVKQIPT